VLNGVDITIALFAMFYYRKNPTGCCWNKFCAWSGIV